MDYKNFDWSKVMWKPLWTNNGYEGCSGVFDLLGNPISSHPIVIMEVGDSILYLASRTAKWSNLLEKTTLSGGYSEWLRKESRGVIIDKTEAVNPYKNDLNEQVDYPLFYNDSLVDTSTVFIIDKQTFIDNFDINLNSFDVTRSVDDLDKLKILKSLSNNITHKPPKFSLIKVKQDSKSGMLTPQNIIVDVLRMMRDTHNKLSQSDLETINKQNNKNSEIKNRILSMVQDEILVVQDIIDDIEYHMADLQYYEAVMEPRLSNIRDDEDIDIDLTKNGSDWWKEDLKIKCQQSALSDYEKDYYEDHSDEFEENFKTNYDKFQDYMREHKKEYTR